MNTAEQILVIITSAVLILFLLLAIAATIYLIKLVRNIRRVVAKAEDVVDSAEAVAEAFKNVGENVGGPLAAFKLVRNIVELVNKTHKKK